ncbi:hypothetical protein Sjap_007809 [Stephania japonica]|uniref:Protein NRT1/ PTR FAMILY 1.2-like n=1 Tax=Stephania japonica TaxID=461633 RepID=A0AAP0PE11_9MAGN
MEGFQEQDRLIEEASDQKGGLRTLPFILVVDCFEELASAGLLLNMILYLVNDYHMEVAAATSLLYLWSALSSFLPIFGAYAADAHFGRFRVLVCGSICSFLGLVVLWLTSAVPLARPAPCDQVSNNCKPPTQVQLAVLVSSFVLISLGAGCNRSNTTAFGADQLAGGENPSEDEGFLQSFFNWYYAASGILSFLSVTTIVYIQDHFGWTVAFAVSSILMFLAAVVFLVGSPLFVKVKANSSAITGLAQALVAAFKARHLKLPHNSTEEACYHHDKDSKITKPSNKLRCLNKACLIKDPEDDINSNGLALKPWELCKVEQVEALKSVIEVGPVWISGTILFLNLNQIAIVVLQAETMDRHITSSIEIPPAFFSMFTIVSLALFIMLYEQIISPFFDNHSKIGRLSLVTRMIIGLVLTCLAMAAAALVENARRKTTVEGGARRTVHTMSAMWLLPQLVLCGAAEGISTGAQLEYYYFHFPKGMSSIAMALFTLENAFGGLLGSLVVHVVNSVTSYGGRVSWLASDINEGHYDYYCALHGGLGLLNLLFLVCCLILGRSKEEMTEELKENLL